VVDGVKPGGLCLTIPEEGCFVILAPTGEEIWIEARKFRGKVRVRIVAPKAYVIQKCVEGEEQRIEMERWASIPRGDGDAD
jgi:hypothetical protein